MQPSVVAYTITERILLGQQAKNNPNLAIRQLNPIFP
jgi:hypothetical protein